MLKEILSFRVLKAGQSLRVRYPDDDAWRRYAGSRRILQDKVGEPFVEGEAEANRQLVRSAQVEDAGEWGPKTYAQIANKLEEVSVLQCSLASGKYFIRLRFIGGETAHVLRRPSPKQRRLARTKLITHRDGKVEYRIDLDASARVFDELDQVGGEVPLMLKFHCIQAILKGGILE